MPTPYVRNTWVDDNVANPVSAARMTVIENGIFDSHYIPRAAISGATTPAMNSGVTYEPGTSAGWTALTVTEEYDSEGWHPGSGMNAGNIRIGVAGTYLVTGYVQYPAVATGARYIAIVKNGTPVEAKRDQAGTSELQQLQTSYVSSWSVGDRVGVLLYQSSGATMFTQAWRLTMTRLSY